ncbi:MAG TPA: hypothetical protein ENH19_01310 [Actinobacteria bacterium]|nr:hypothetical protein [Actinomycetes bacterium]HEX21274.1 hypothetical protein [Actinomycetota bacterium]
MSLVITILILILLTAATVFGILAVLMALITAVSSFRPAGKKSVAIAAGSVDLYFRKSKSKAKVKDDSAKAEQKETKKNLSGKSLGKQSNIVATNLHDLPAGYYILDDLKISLPLPFKYKGQNIVRGEIKNLVIGPRRLYVMEAVNGNRQDLEKIAQETDKNARLVASFLSQKLKNDFRVCGWVINKETRSNEKFLVKIINEAELRGSLIKHERYSQGKKCLKASEHVPEIISELKLAAWED